MKNNFFIFWFMSVILVSGVVEARHPSSMLIKTDRACIYSFVIGDNHHGSSQAGPSCSRCVELVREGSLFSCIRWEVIKRGIEIEECRKKACNGSQCRFSRGRGRAPDSQFFQPNNLECQRPTSATPVPALPPSAFIQ